MDTHLLDSFEEIKKIDRSNVYGSIIELPKQCIHAFEEASKVEVPESYFDVENIVMCGMGGSGLGARIIESAFRKQLRKPLYRINDYDLPGFVDLHTLVFVSSYSGNTEESISNARRAIEKGAKVIAIADSGKLLDFAKEFELPFYNIDPKFNPSNQPRMAIGYSVIGQLVLASKCGLIDFDESEIQKIVAILDDVIDKYKIEVPFDQNPAKKTASDLINSIILFFSAEHLVGATHTVNNQFNENTKILTFDFVIPELNHHLMEGLKNPDFVKNQVSVYLFKSSLYTDHIIKRFDITSEVIEKNGMKKYEYVATSETILSQVFEIIQFGSFLNFYLSMLYNQDPTPIPWVDYFKKRIS